MTKIIDAINMCEDKMLKYQEDIATIEYVIDRRPEFVIINASDDDGNARYIRGKVSDGEKAGLKVSAIKLENGCTEIDVAKIIAKCNEDKVPVLLQLPTFDYLNTDCLLNMVDYSVDADCFCVEWIGEVNLGNDKKFAPATPKGVISLLDYYSVGLEGRVVLVIGKSNHVGKPLCSMLMCRGATVINANSKTKDLASLVRMSDVVISCVGRQDLINASDVKEGAVLIGVGFTYVNGKQILDFDVDKIVADGRASMVSNRINCTGKATVNALISNVIELYKLNYGIK